MAAIAESASVQIMEEKMLQELKANNSYEALQYVQSFIARKKRSIVPEIVSSMVFHAAKLLVDHESAGYAGTLLLWYMDGGAGEENNFHIEKEKVPHHFIPHHFTCNIPIYPSTFTPPYICTLLLLHLLCANNKG